MKKLSEYGVLLAFVLLFLANVWKSGPTFLSPDNLRNLMNQNVVIGLLATGMTFVILTAGIDLAVGSLLALVGSLTLLILNQILGGGMAEGTAIVIAALCGIGLGGAVGFLNGLVIVWGRVTPFVTTLIGLLTYRSLALALGNGGEIRSASTTLYANLAREGIPLPTGGDRPLMITWGIVVWVLMTLLASFLLNKTRYGRYAIALGANEKATRYSGIDPGKIKLLTYTFSGLCVGIAAVFQTSRMNSIATNSVGLYAELDAIAAVVIGGTRLTGGYGRIWGTFVGVLLLGLINNMLVLQEVSANWQGVVKGLIILVAVLLQRPAKSE